MQKTLLVVLIPMAPSLTELQRTTYDQQFAVTVGVTSDL
jgi:hypothetical protein